MENWGCETLDLETHEPFYRKETDRTYLPMWLIEQCVDPQVMQNIWVKDIKYIRKLANDITLHGLQDPGVLVIANNGVVLFDGNHRYCAFQILQRKEFPVRVRFSERIKSGGTTHIHLLPLILEKLYG